MHLLAPEEVVILRKLNAKGEAGFVKFVPYLQPEPLFDFVLEFLLTFSWSFFFVAKGRILMKVLELRDDVCSTR